MIRLFPLFLLCLVCCSSTVLAAAERPNILVILCDDLGYADVGFNGAKDLKTPALDQLAAAGTVFRSAYVAHPFCGPSRMALLSGRYPHAFGGQFNHPPFHLGLTEYDDKGIPENETLISTVLQQAGYQTGAVGKWHLGTGPAFHPNRRGFDDFYGFLGGGHKYFPEHYVATYQRQKKAGKQRINEYLHPLKHNGAIVQPKGYLTDELSGEAVRFIDAAAKKSDQPFFLYLAYNAPHAPMEATAADKAPNLRRHGLRGRPWHRQNRRNVEAQRSVRQHPDRVPQRQRRQALAGREQRALARNQRRDLGGRLPRADVLPLAGPGAGADNRFSG